jgi:P27 family predicted phage terminase small subunit
MSGVKGRTGIHNRLPTAMKELQGTLKPSRASVREPRVTFGLPGPPRWLKSADALEHFEAIGQMALEAGVISTVDSNALAIAATALCEYIEACADVEANGLLLSETTKDGHERTRLNPAASVRSDAWRRFREGLRMFGLDPQSRGSVVAIDGLLPVGGKQPEGDAAEGAAADDDDFYGPAKH